MSHATSTTLLQANQPEKNNNYNRHRNLSRKKHGRPGIETVRAHEHLWKPSAFPLFEWCQEGVLPENQRVSPLCSHSFLLRQNLTIARTPAEITHKHDPRSTTFGVPLPEIGDKWEEAILGFKGQDLSVTRILDCPIDWLGCWINNACLWAMHTHAENIPHPINDPYLTRGNQCADSAIWSLTRFPHLLPF